MKARYTIASLGAAFTITFSAPPQAAANPSARIELPAVSAWSTEDAKVTAEEGSSQLTVPMNYKIGRLVSPAVKAREGDLLTFAADLAPQFPEAQASYFRAWLQIEFLHGARVVHTTASPDLVGPHGDSTLLAITGRTPRDASAARFVVCVQNKFWSVLDNRTAISNVRAFELGERAMGALRMTVAEDLPRKIAPRTARLEVHGDWPDHTAISISTSRGKAPPSVMAANGVVEFSIQYSPEDVGSATVTAELLGEQASLTLQDPSAARLVIPSILADSLETPALVQLVRNGKMIPGRYQSSVPGIFTKAPWTIDLAPGTWQVRISRGPAFKAWEGNIVVEGGKTATLDQVELTRIVDLRKLGWFGGDADGDVFHGERYYKDVTPEMGAEIGQAMGLDWLGIGSWGDPSPKTWGDAKAVMEKLSRPNFLFRWTDEKPKTAEGHICIVGIDRPDSDAFAWGWMNAKRPLRNFETLKLIRDSGAATFVNHPLRGWISGGQFRSNMYSSLAFDLCAAGLIDGFNINEKPQDLQVWSLLLDRGYRVAATAGADFTLDRPSGPVPGKARMYCFCPEGLTPKALASAVRQSHTIVSTGPTLYADVAGAPPGTSLPSGKKHLVNVKAWARGDVADALQRIELWSRGKVVATKTFEGGTLEAGHQFEWQPRGEWDWAAVRLFTDKGWAMTSAFYATGPNWQPSKPVVCNLKLVVTGLDKKQLAETKVEVWDNVPGLTTSRKLKEQALTSEPMKVPVTASVVVKLPDGRKKETTVYDAAGMPEIVKRIASGAERARPLLEWDTYEEVLKRCREATMEVDFR